MILALVDDKIIGIGTISSNQKKKCKHVGILGIVITIKISLSVREENPRAIALYKKCGFEIEGVLKNETYIDEEFFNIVCMGMIL